MGFLYGFFGLDEEAAGFAGLGTSFPFDPDFFAVIADFLAVDAINSASLALIRASRARSSASWASRSFFRISKSFSWALAAFFFASSTFLALLVSFPVVDLVEGCGDAA